MESPEWETPESTPGHYSVTGVEVVSMSQSEFWIWMLLPPEEHQQSIAKSCSHCWRLDQMSIGRGELKEKADGVIFVLVANIKGLSLDRQGSQYDNYCRVLRSTQVDIACGQQEQFGYLSEETSCARQHNSTGKEIESTLPWSLWKKKTSQTRWNVHLVGRKHYKQVSKWMIPRQMGSMD